MVCNLTDRKIPRFRVAGKFYSVRPIVNATSRQFGRDYYVSAKYPLDDNSVITPRPDDETHEFSFTKNGYVGLLYELKLNIFEGAYPLYYDLIEAPSGATLGETWDEPDYGVVKWMPTEEGIFTFRVRATDQDKSVREFVWSVNVNREWIRFVSKTGSDTTGDGSFESPWATLPYALDNTTGGRAVCLREGRYDDPMTGKSMGYSFANAVIGFNGETVAIDMSNYVDSNAHGVFMVNSPDFAIFNVRLENPPTNTANPRWVSSFSTSSRMLMDRCYVDVNNRSGTENYDNISAMFMGDSGGIRTHCAQTRCTFTGFRGESNGWSSFDSYATNYFLCEDNTFIDQAAPAGTGSGVMWVKATGSRFICLRANKMPTAWAGSILDLQLSNNGDPYSTGDVVACFNQLYGPADQSTSNLVCSIGRGTGAAPRGPVHFYRNTIVGNCAIWIRDWELTFSSERDIIVTDATYAGKPHNILGRNENTADDVWVNPHSRTNATINVTDAECHGSTSSGILTPAFELTSAYQEYLGKRGATIFNGAQA